MYSSLAAGQRAHSGTTQLGWETAVKELTVYTRHTQKHFESCFPKRHTNNERTRTRAGEGKGRTGWAVQRSAKTCNTEDRPPKQNEPNGGEKKKVTIVTNGS